MSRFTVRFDTGAEVAVDLPGRYPAPEMVMEAVREANPDQNGRPVRITRDQGWPGEHVTWKLPRDAAEAKEQQNHIMGKREVRLFVSFVYDQAEGEPGEETTRTVFGSALLDMEYAPYEQEHLDYLMAHIASHAGVHRIVLMGWQELAKP
jgi:hypothetical protein